SAVPRPAQLIPHTSCRAYVLAAPEEQWKVRPHSLGLICYKPCGVARVRIPRNPPLPRQGEVPHDNGGLVSGFSLLELFPLPALLALPIVFQEEYKKRRFSRAHPAHGRLNDQREGAGRPPGAATRARARGAPPPPDRRTARPAADRGKGPGDTRKKKPRGQCVKGAKRKEPAGKERLARDGAGRKTDSTDISTTDLLVDSITGRGKPLPENAPEKQQHEEEGPGRAGAAAGGQGLLLPWFERGGGALEEQLHLKTSAAPLCSLSPGSRAADPGHARRATAALARRSCARLRPERYGYRPQPGAIALLLLQRHNEHCTTSAPAARPLHLCWNRLKFNKRTKLSDLEIRARPQRQSWSAWEESTVVPVRLDPAARSESESEPWRTLSAEEKEKEAETRVYRLDVFGIELILQLEPDQTFLAPGFVFHIVGSPESEPTQEPKSGAEPGCFFSGTVNGEEMSAAALNLCQGLRGGFYFQGEEYFIQPLNSSGFLGTEEDVHTIRRRGRAALAEEGSSKCGVNEDEARVPKNLEKEAKKGAANAEQTDVRVPECAAALAMRRGGEERKGERRRKGGRGVLLLGEREGGVTEEGEGERRGWSQPEPGGAETCERASWYYAHRQELFFSFSRKDFLPSSFFFPPAKNFPPHKVKLGMWTPRRRSRRWCEAESRPPGSRRHIRSSLEPGRCRTTRPRCAYQSLSYHLCRPGALLDSFRMAGGRQEVRPCAEYHERTPYWAFAWDRNQCSGAPALRPRQRGESADRGAIQTNSIMHWGTVCEAAPWWDVTEGRMRRRPLTRLSSNAAMTLRNFCQWQRQHNPPSDRRATRGQQI
ncbi:unnamed protein product, partial [Pleuronectes platessa]